MKKITLAQVPGVPDTNPDVRGAVVKTVISRDTVGAPHGYLSIVEFAPAGEHRLHRHSAADQITYVISGNAQHLTKNGPVPVAAGDAVYIRKHEWHGFRNAGAEKAILLSIHSPITRITDSGYETYNAGLDTSVSPTVAKTSLSSIQADAALDKDAGFFGIDVFWLATRDTVGSRDFLLGASTFQPGGFHNPHRHPRGDKFLYILEGGGEHFTSDGAVSLSAGEIAYIPANEYHGFRSSDGVRTKTLFSYFGAATLKEAGFERPEATA